MGRKLRALHTAKCRFVSWFTILGHRMAWPTGWMERDRVLFLYCLYSITQFEQSLCTFMLCCCYSNQSQTEKVERLLHTRRILFSFFFSPNRRRPLEIQRADWAMGVFPSGAKVELDFELLLSFQTEQQQLQKDLQPSHQCTGMNGFISLF